MYLYFSFLVAGIFLSVVVIKLRPAFGGKSQGEILSRIKSSPNFRNGVFQNPEPTPMFVKDASMWKTIRQFIHGTENGRPDLVETAVFDKAAFLRTGKGIRFVWFGHSTLLLNIDGTIILTDPVFSGNASPVPFSNKSFKYSNNNYLPTLPDIDIMLISHDHYDHLDYKTIKNIHSRVKRFYVPLGVEAHLIRWGVSPDKIIVADWGNVFTDISGITFTATPARHFSGRGIANRNTTLWCSWVIHTNSYNLFYGGDSGYGKHFKEIGNKFGPFDFTMLECGQYNKNWAYIHSFPEQTIQEHIDIKGKKLLPIHWGKFKLSLHPWDEPISRASAEAEKKGVDLLNVQIGEVVTL